MTVFSQPQFLDDIPSNIEMEDKPCPVGCIKNDRIVLSGKDFLHDLPGVFSIVKCSTCGLIRTNPRPTIDSIGYYYPEDYGPHLGTKIDYHTDTNRYLAVFKQLARQFFKFNTQFIPDLPPARMLEIGCASGSFLQKMANAGWEVEGLEISKRAASNARQSGFNVFEGTIAEAPEPLEQYDLIVGWMVLEHLHDPVESLKKLGEWIKPDGYLVLSVPNAGVIEFSIFREHWYALQLPSHLYHFTPQTISRLLAATDWSIVNIHHQRVLSNFVLSIRNYIEKNDSTSGINHHIRSLLEKDILWNIFLYPLAYPLSLIGQTGRMTIWAKKNL